jgi:chemotaxis protein MotB
LLAAAIFSYQALPALPVFAYGNEKEFLTDSAAQAKPVKAGEKIIVGGFYFESGSAEIGANLKKYLKNVSAELKKIKFKKLFVDGYTDNSGGNAANNRLSRKRAEAVKRELVKNGIPAKKIQARAYGSSNPLASNNTLNGRIQNRRIEIQIKAK